MVPRAFRIDGFNASNRANKALSQKSTTGQSLRIGHNSLNLPNKPRNEFETASSDWRHWQKQKQLRAYRNGEALNHHMIAAHRGEFDTACAACNELQSRRLLSQTAE